MFDGYSFTSVPVIKTGRASVGFWIYVQDPTVSGVNVAHIVIPDYMVISIRIDTLKVFIYCTVNHMYHSFFPTVLENTNLKSDFDIAIASSNYSGINIYTSILSMKTRWFYVRCGVNYHSNTYYVMTNYYKSDPYYTYAGYTPNKSVVTGTIPMEPIFNGKTYYTDFHFRKFYKPADTMTVKINNLYNMNTPILFRNLNLFAEYIPSTMDKLQYL